MENGNTEEVGIEKINRIYDSTIEKEINDLFIKFADDILMVENTINQK